MELINDIPRLYTGLAEWAGCLVVLLICRRKVRTVPFIAISAAAAVIQCGFLMVTADIEAGIVWILVMAAAFFLMFLYVFLCADVSTKGAVYGTVAAFLHAELAASLEWQLHFWLLRRIPLGSAFSVLLLVTVYLIVFSLFYYLSRRHITEEFINGLTWKEVTSISILMLFVFAFSNLSFFLSGSPFSGRVQEDIFAIRTLADGFGIAVYWGFQINISELLTQKELYAMRHVLSSQYEQFRNYQESDEMLHMMQHDLKHQIEGLRGETNEQKKEAWLDQIENELDKWWLPQRTGNAVFDTILSAKLRKARQLDVRVTCVADGALLNRLHVTDICTIFGNALENAIESVSGEAAENRIISFRAGGHGEFLSIHFENYLGHPLAVRDGLPLTTKDDLRYHGFGVLSIRHIVEKYGGTMSIRTDQNLFRLDILIPCAGTAEA